MSMYGKYPQVKIDGKFVEQNGLNGAPKAWPTTDCSKDKVMVTQSLKDEVDINKIMEKIAKGQMMENLKEGIFEDISEYNGLEEAFIKVQNAKEDFMTLPAEIREKFDNDPVELINFLENAENRAEAEKLGIIQPRKPVEEAAQPAITPPAGG